MKSKQQHSANCRLTLELVNLRMLGQAIKPPPYQLLLPIPAGVARCSFRSNLAGRESFRVEHLAFRVPGSAGHVAMQTSVLCGQKGYLDYMSMLCYVGSMSESSDILCVNMPAWPSMQTSYIAGTEERVIDSRTLHAMAWRRCT